MSKKLNARVAASVMVAAILATAGCQMPQSPPALTLAATATINEPGPSLATAADLVVEHAQGSVLPEDAMVTVVTPDQIQTVDLTPMRGDEVENGARKREEQIHTAIGELDRVFAGASATTPGLDVLGVLDRALEATEAGGTVVLVTSGFSTVDPVDLNAAGDWMSRPEEFADTVAEADLPDASDKSIVFAGLGQPASSSDQQNAGPAARKALETLYLTLCTRMNATNCTVLNGLLEDVPPNSTVPSPVVDLNQIDTQCVGQIALPAAMAFDADTEKLRQGPDGRPAVDDQLTPIVRSLAQCPVGSVLDAVGHSATVPHQTGPATTLELNRAKAILTRMAELGAPGSALGAATAGGQLIDNMPGGQYNEQLATRNRVVLLTITPAN